MDLHVSSVASCELVSVICAVKVIISGVISGCVSPPQYQLLALQGERLFFFSLQFIHIVPSALAGRHDARRCCNSGLGIMIPLVPYSGSLHLVLVPGFERHFPLDKQLCLCSLHEQPSCLVYF